MTPPKANSPGPEDEPPPSEPEPTVVPVIRLGHTKFPPGTCTSCHGTGQAMNKEAEWETCIWCYGRRKST